MHQSSGYWHIKPVNFTNKRFTQSFGFLVLFGSEILEYGPSYVKFLMVSPVPCQIWSVSSLK